METNQNTIESSEVREAKIILKKRNQLINGSFFTLKTLVIYGVLGLTVEKNYFVYYNTQAILGLIILTSLFIYKFRNNNFMAPVFALLLIAFLEIVDTELWRYEPFSYMFTVEDFSGIYKGTKTIDNKVFSGLDCQTSKNIPPEKFNFEIYQTGSHISIHSFSYKDEKDKIREAKSNQMMISKLENNMDYNLIYYYRDVGIPKNGKHSGTVNLNLKKDGEEFIIDGTYYSNGLPQTRGSLFDFRKLDVDDQNPFKEPRFFQN